MARPSRTKPEQRTSPADLAQARRANAATILLVNAVVFTAVVLAGVAAFSQTV